MATKENMHPNSLANLKPLTKGTVLNPEGGRSHDPVRKELKRLTNKLIIEAIDLIMTDNLEALKRLAEDKKTPVFQVAICNSLYQAVKKGDWNTFKSITESALGKTPDIMLLASLNDAVPDDPEARRELIMANMKKLQALNGR